MFLQFSGGQMLFEFVSPMIAITYVKKGRSRSEEMGICRSTFTYSRSLVHCQNSTGGTDVDLRPNRHLTYLGSRDVSH